MADNPMPDQAMEIDSAVLAAQASTSANPANESEITTTVERTVITTTTSTSNAPHAPAVLSAHPINGVSSLRILPLAQFPPSRKTGYVYDERMMLHAPLGWVNEDTVDQGAVQYYNGGGVDEAMGEGSAVEGPRLGESIEDKITQEVKDGEDFEDRFAKHRHPEEPRRISRIFSRLQQSSLISQMIKLPSVEISKRQSLLVHSEHVWDDAEDTATWTIDALREAHPRFEHDSLYINTGTALAARLSCGGVITACRAVVTGKVRNAFAIVRPPGHHAEPDKSMGFCIYNNVAVAVKVMREECGVGKVLIVDWDVHHGNGTQRAFFDDPNVLYISIHRHDGGLFYPSSDFGAMDVTGEGAGEGTSVNIPWPKRGFGDADYIHAFQKIVMPIAYEFAPELVVISAGFDAAKGDQLGGCNVTPPCYAHLTHMLSSLAGGKLVVALEGGYNLDAISNSADAVARVLLGEELPELAPQVASDIATEVVYQVAKVQSRYWKSINVKACEPLDEGEDPDHDRVYHLLDIIKMHRIKEMYDTWGMFPVPIADSNLDKVFPNQVMTDGALYDRETLIVFVHDFGNLQVEVASPLYNDADLHNSRLIDSSNAVIRWTKTKDYSILDINVLKSFPTHRSDLAEFATIKASTPRPYAQLAKYVFDNYIDIVESVKNVVLIGYGTGCSAVMALVNSRPVEEKISAVIQVAGLQTIVRPDPNQDEKREWFRSHSKLFVPGDHPILDDSRIQRRLATQIIAMPGVQSIDILRAALPQIQDFVSNIVLSNKAPIEGPIPMGSWTAVNGETPHLGDVPMDVTE